MYTGCHSRTCSYGRASLSEPIVTICEASGVEEIAASLGYRVTSRISHPKATELEFHLSYHSLFSYHEMLFS